MIWYSPRYMEGRMLQTIMDWFRPKARATQQQRILATLQKGPATNRQLSRLAPRFGARIMELRKIGHDIGRQRDGRVVIYKLVSR